MQNWLKANWFSEKNEWPHCIDTMPEKYRKLPPERKTTEKLKVAQQTIWEEAAIRTRLQRLITFHTS